MARHRATLWVPDESQPRYPSRTPNLATRDTDVIDWFENFKGDRTFVVTLRNESDRACAVLGAAVLDRIVGDLLRAAMAEGTPKALFEGYGPLASFSARIDVCLGLGIISLDECRDLHLIRKIRNTFAHEMDHTLTFTSKPVADRIAELRIVDAMFANPSIPTPEDTPRIRFQVEIGGLIHSLTTIRAGAIERAEIPEDYGGWLRTAKP